MLDLYADHSIPGLRALRWGGAASDQAFLEDAPGADYDVALLALLRRLSTDADRDDVFNAIVGLELTLDPFARDGRRAGLALYAVGTLAQLEPWDL